MSNTEALVIGIMAIYTIAIVYGIHHYEAKLKKLNNKAQSWYDKSMENGNRISHIQEIFKGVHEQNQSAYEENQVLRAQVIRLQSEASELRSGIYTGYPAPFVASNFTPEMRRIQEVRDKGGMGIVSTDIVSSNE